MQLSKIFLSETTRPRAFIFGIQHYIAFIFGIQHYIEVLYQNCSNYAPGVKIDPGPGVSVLNGIIQGKFHTTSSLEPLMEI